MGKLRIKHLQVIGFEKHFGSLTESQQDLTLIWPEAVDVLNTETGKVFTRYSLLKESDDTLNANLTLLRASGRGAIIDSKGREVPIARAIGVNGNVCFVSWHGAGFGWEPDPAGGFIVFVETWPGRHFRKGQNVQTKCTKLGWKKLIETEATKGIRRMGSVADLQKVLADEANKMAKMVMPERLRETEESK